MRKLISSVGFAIKMNPSVFRLVDAKWGPHTIDRFPAYDNAQLPRFNSKFASPGSSGVDALVQDGSGKNNYIGFVPQSAWWSIPSVI